MTIYTDTLRRSRVHFTPGNHNLCRVIEVWTQEQRAVYRCHDYMKGEYFEIAEEDIDLIAGGKWKKKG